MMLMMQVLVLCVSLLPPRGSAGRYRRPLTSFLSACSARLARSQARCGVEQEGLLCSAWHQRKKERASRFGFGAALACFSRPTTSCDHAGKRGKSGWRSGPP